MIQINVCAERSAVARAKKLTFRKEASGAAEKMSTQEPAIVEVIVSFYQLDPIALEEAQLVCTARFEVVNNDEQ